MPYKDPEKRKQCWREAQRKHREANPARPPNNGHWWQGKVSGDIVECSVTSIDSYLGKPRYNVLTSKGEHLSLEQTSELRRQLAVNEVVTGDLIRVEYLGKQLPKKKDTRRHPFKTYHVEVVARRTDVLTKLFAKAADGGSPEPPKAKQSSEDDDLDEVLYGIDGSGVQEP